MAINDVDYEQVERGIYFRLIEGSSRYRKEKVLKELLRDIDAYGARWDSTHACYLRTAAQYSFGVIEVSECLRLMDEILESQKAGTRTLVAALNMKARLTLKTVSREDNYALRCKAQELSESHHLRSERLVVRTNWAFAANAYGDENMAVLLIESVQSDISEIPQSEIDNDPFLIQVIARIASHSANAVIAAAKTNGMDFSKAVSDASARYEHGIERIAAFDHLRVNLLIEWSQMLVDAYLYSQNVEYLNHSESLLHKAHAGLDAHHCLLCMAFYHYVAARYSLSHAQMTRKHSCHEALEDAFLAKSECSEGIRCYQENGHPYTSDAESLMKDIDKMIDNLQIPRRIFLSHKSADKPLVRRFKRVLEILQYEPWLDEDTLTAGLTLERALSQGFTDSCAVVFFVTQSFRDESFLATEIEYAIREKRKKANAFSIITILFPDESGQMAKVPELLETYVWKIALNELDALAEILRALPLVPIIPEWKAEPKAKST